MHRAIQVHAVPGAPTAVPSQAHGARPRHRHRQHQDGRRAADTRGELIDREQVPVDHDLDGESLFGTLAAMVERRWNGRASTTRRVVAVGVGCAGPVGRDVEWVSPLNTLSWRAVPVARAVAALTGVGRVRRPGREGAGSRRGLARRGAGSRQLLGDGGVDRRRWRRRARRPPPRWRLGQRRAHRPRHRRAERPPLRVRRQGLPRGRGRVARRSRQITGRPATEPSYDIMIRTGRSSDRGVASVCNLLDLDLAVVGGSVALGFGATFFNAAQQQTRRPLQAELRARRPDHPRPARRQGPAGRSLCRRVARREPVRCARSAAAPSAAGCRARPVRRPAGRAGHRPGSRRATAGLTHVACGRAIRCVITAGERDDQDSTDRAFEPDPGPSRPGRRWARRSGRPRRHARWGRGQGRRWHRRRHRPPRRAAAASAASAARQRQRGRLRSRVHRRRQPLRRRRDQLDHLWCDRGRAGLLGGTCAVRQTTSRPRPCSSAAAPTRDAGRRRPRPGPSTARLDQPRVLRPRLPAAAAAAVRCDRRPRRAVHRRPRVRPPRPEPHSASATRCARPQQSQPGEAERMVPSGSSCRPTASPGCGPTTPAPAGQFDDATRSTRRSTPRPPSATTGSSSRRQGRVDPESFTHGTSDQRQEWFQPRLRRRATRRAATRSPSSACRSDPIRRSAAEAAVDAFERAQCRTSAATRRRARSAPTQNPAANTSAVPRPVGCTHPHQLTTHVEHEDVQHVQASASAARRAAAPTTTDGAPVRSAIHEMIRTRRSSVPSVPTV